MRLALGQAQPPPARRVLAAMAEVLASAAQLKAQLLLRDGHLTLRPLTMTFL